MQRTSVTTGGPAGFAARFGVPGERRRMLKNCPGNLELLVYDLNLLVDHLPGNPIDRCTHSVSLLTSDKDFVGVRAPAMHGRFAIQGSVDSFSP
jgi:hypothetical protein